MHKEGNVRLQRPQDQRQNNRINLSNLNDTNKEGYQSDSNQTNELKKNKSNESYLSLEDKNTRKSSTNAITNTKSPKTHNSAPTNNSISKAKKVDSAEKDTMLNNLESNNEQDTYSKADTNDSIKNKYNTDDLSLDLSTGPDYVLLDQNQGLAQNNRKLKKDPKEEIARTNRSLQIIEANNKPRNIQMKTKNNQSSFAKNPSQTYADQYYASFPAGYKLPRGGVMPLVDPYVAAAAAAAAGGIPPPLMPPYGASYGGAPYGGAPFMPPYGYPNMYNPYFKNPVFYAKKTPRDPNYYNTVLPYNYWGRPNFYDDKDPSIHDLLYLDKFKNQDASYSNKHIERKIRAIDGYYNPYGEYTVQDYKNNFGQTNPNNEKMEKTERMQKAKDLGNGFMKTKNQKSNRKEDSDYEYINPKKVNGKLATSDTELPRISKNIQNQNKFPQNNSNPYLNNNLNNRNMNYNNINPNNINPNNINPNKNYQSFDFISSNDGYNGYNQNNSNSNSNFYKYLKNQNNDENNFNFNLDLHQGLQNQQNFNNDNQGGNKYYKNPKFDFSKKTQPEEPQNNPRERLREKLIEAKIQY